MNKDIAATNVRHLRKELGMSQAELAEAVGVTQGFIGCVERAEKGASMGKWIAIADALKVDIATLIKTDLSETEKVTQ